MQVKLHTSGLEEEHLRAWALENLEDAFLVRTRDGHIEGVGKSRKSIDELSSIEAIRIQESCNSEQLNFCCTQGNVILNTFLSDIEIEGRKLRYSANSTDNTYDLLLEWACGQNPKPTRSEIARKTAEILRQHKHYLVASDITSLVDTCLYDIGHLEFLDSL